MRISDWSSDVCSSDLRRCAGLAARARLGLSSWIRVAGPEAARGNLPVHGRKHTDVRHEDVPPTPSNAAHHRAHVQFGAVEPRHPITVKSQPPALNDHGQEPPPAPGHLHPPPTHPHTPS